MAKKHECRVCGKSPLTRNEIGRNKKLVNPKMKEFFCLECLAEFLECETDDLIAKIEEFKNEGCTLFG